MNIREQLMAEHSKRNCMLIADYIGTDDKKLAQLMAIFMAAEYRPTQRAAWVLTFIANRNPELFQPYVQLMVALLKLPLHVAVKRNMLRILPLLDIPEKEMGILAESCFGFLHSLHEPAAVKAFSMSVLLQICKKEPELRYELIPTLEAMIPEGKPAIVSRGTKVLQQLKKMGAERY